ncbi:hypothetical protein ILFOPFJJ_06870 [Ensifer psoraleae]|nr:hypothetical protein [Sinorhizobium psoraleae]
MNTQTSRARRWSMTPVLRRLTTKLCQRCEANDVIGQFVTACVPVIHNDAQRFQQAEIPCRRLDIHEVEQPEQQGANLGMNRPQERQVIVVVKGRNSFALLGQKIEAATFRQYGSDPTANLHVGFALPAFSSTCPNTVISFSLAAFWVLRTRRNSISINSSRHCARACWTRQRMSVALARAADVQKITDLHAARLGGKLAALGVDDAVEERIGIEHGGQPSQAFRPKLDGVGARGTGCMLQAIEAGYHGARRNNQQTIEYGDLLLAQTGRIPGVDHRPDFCAQVTGEPVTRAECRKIDRGLAQNLDRQIDQVSRIAHRRRRIHRSQHSQDPGGNRWPGQSRPLRRDRQAGAITQRE